MFSRTLHLLSKRLVQSHPSKTLLQPFNPTLNSSQLWVPNSHTKIFSKVQLRSFSSFQKIRQTEYQGEKELEELISMSDLLIERLPEKKEVMKKYLNSQELTADDRTLISKVLYELAIAHHVSENSDKAHKYLKEDEDFHKEAGVRDTISLANNFYLQTILYLEQNNLTDAKYYINEAERIGRLLGDDQEATDLLVRCWCSLADIFYRQNDLEKALEFYSSILERAGDLSEEGLFTVIEASNGMAMIYSSRGDVEKAMEHWAKGLETATLLVGENSSSHHDLFCVIADSLYGQGQYQKALPYAEQSLQAALQNFPKDSLEVASTYSRLGHIYTKEKDHAQALDFYKKAIQIFEKHPPQGVARHSANCYFESAKTYALQGNPQEASDLLNKADPVLKSILEENDLADVYVKWAGELQDIESMSMISRNYFLRAIKIYEALGNLASSQQDLKSTNQLMKKAESYFDAAKIEPFDAKSVYAGLSSTSVLLGNAADGWKYTKKVLECYEACGDPQFVGEAHFHLGVLHEHEGRLREALEAFKKSLEFPDMAPSGSGSRFQTTHSKISGIESKLKRL